jgi:type II secretory pathway component PulJ
VKKKIEAYTIMEMIVVMIIGLIVVSIAYKTFDLVLKQFNQFRKSNEQTARLSLMDMLFEKDFSESNYVKRTGSGIAVGYSDRTVSYYWEKKFIVRQDLAAADTFFVASENHRYHYLDLEITASDKYIDRLAFESLEDGQQHVFIYHKIYGAGPLMKGEKFNSQTK